jgi:hypothetical protein
LNPVSILQRVNGPKNMEAREKDRNTHRCAWFLA